jgi:hypothetical protein
MPFVPVDETVRCAITYENNAGDQAVNVIHVKTDEAPVTALVLTSIADIVENWLETEWTALSPTSWRAINLDLVNLTLADGIFLSRAIDADGLDAVDALPSWVTIAISLRTPFSGRSRRGRLYHVGMSDSRVVGDYITEAAAEAYIDAYEALRLDLFAGNLRWVVVSYVNNGAPRVAGLTTEITAVTITDRLVDRQVRRKPRVG